MTIAKDFAAKASVAFVAAAMLFSMIAPAAQAQSAEDMQKMINDLLAQIAALQGGSTTGGSTAAGVCPYTWTRDLKTGATGADVKMLQMFLNADADTRVAATGAGSAGMETETFGPATAAAVSKFQVKYRADVLSPAGLVNPTGYFGPGTRAKANALCVATTGGSTGGSTTGGSTGGSSTDNSSDLSGEAALDEATLDSADDDTIEEGSEDAPIAELTVKFQDGDASISRLDVKVNPTPSGTDPWDVFETVSVWVDGEMVAEADASDKDSYQSDDMTLRFSGLDIVAMEDEDLDITIAATVQDGVDFNDQGAVAVSIPSMRYFDADGVAETETSLDDIGTETVTVTVGEAGQDDELIVKTASSDPNGTTLQVEDNKKSDWYTVFAFDLDTKDSVNDISLNEVPVTIVFSSSSFSGLVDDYELVIDGTTIDNLVGSASSTGTTTELTFDVDGDVTIDAGDRVTAELRLRFKSLAAGDEGTTVLAKVTSVQADLIDAEGADTLDSTQLSGSALGDAHTLRTKGLVLDLTSIDESEKTKTISNTSYDYGVYTYKFDVTAFSDDFYMDEAAAIVDYDIYVDNVLVANPAASSTATLDISGAQDASTADKLIGEGETATFTLTIETATDISGSVKVVVNSVAYSAADDSTEELSVSATPADDWTSESLILN